MPSSPCSPSTNGSSPFGRSRWSHVAAAHRRLQLVLDGHAVGRRAHNRAADARRCGRVSLHQDRRRREPDRDSIRADVSRKPARRHDGAAVDGCERERPGGHPHVRGRPRQPRHDVRQQSVPPAHDAAVVWRRQLGDRRSVHRRAAHLYQPADRRPVHR